MKSPPSILRSVTQAEQHRPYPFIDFMVPAHVTGKPTGNAKNHRGRDAFPLLTLATFLCTMTGCGEEPSPITELRSNGAPEVARGWPTYGGQPGGTQFSSLDQIDSGNVDQLELVWKFHSGDVSERTPDSHPTTMEATPILANDKLYYCTPLNNVIALNPATGALQWRFEFDKSPDETVNPVYNCRGVAYWESTNNIEASVACGKRVLQATDSGKLLALDADTGQLCENFGEDGIVDLNALDYRGEGRVSVTSAPAIVNDILVIGATVADNRYLDTADGLVRGFDVQTGQERWVWNPIPEHLSDRVGGANTWAPISVDTRRGWVFLPTSSPSYDAYGINRLVPIPDGNAVVALDASTGEKIWSYQIVHHDLWDYDLAAMPTLATIERDGEPLEVVIQPTKMGFTFVLERETGKPVFPVEERPVPQSDIPGEVASPTQRIPQLPEPTGRLEITAEDAWGALVFDRRDCRKQIENLRNDGLYTPPSERGSILYPSFLGGTNWGGIAYDHATGLAVMNSSDFPWAVRLIPRNKFDRSIHAHSGTATYIMEGSPYVMTKWAVLSPLGMPCSPPPWGQLTAIDMHTGETRWQIPFGRVAVWAGLRSPSSWGGPNQGGPIITAGGLVFIGASLDSRFRAYELVSGELLWEAKLPAPATATPMTYEFGPDGRQYVVIAAGGHSSLGTRLSDAILAYALR